MQNTLKPDQEQNSSIKLIQLIGSPYIAQPYEVVKTEELSSLYSLAAINKVRLLFLTSLNERGIDLFKAEYKQASEKRERALKKGLEVYEILSKFKIDCLMFKSYPPFPEILSDTDLLITGSNEEFLVAVASLNKGCYFPEKIRPGGIHGGTIQENGQTFQFDFYRTISANHLQYLDKDKLKPNIAVYNYNGVAFRAYDRITDLLIQVGHSIIAEQLFTLFHFYYILYLLREMDDSERQKLVALAHENKLLTALTIAVKISCNLHKQAFGFVPYQLKILSEQLEIDSASFCCDMPYRIKLTELSCALIEKLPERKVILGFSMLMVSMLNPPTIRYLLKEIASRRTRQTY
jgi:hypothetical protein